MNTGFLQEIIEVEALGRNCQPVLYKKDKPEIL